MRGSTEAMVAVAFSNIIVLSTCADLIPLDASAFWSLDFSIRKHLGSSRVWGRHSLPHQTCWRCSGVVQAPS